MFVVLSSTHATLVIDINKKNRVIKGNYLWGKEGMKEQAGDSLCLCGSGKQYKNCCFGKLIEFPKNNSFKNHSNHASEINNSAKAYIESKNPSSLKELNQELDQFFYSHNEKPVDDFLGLAPNQMKYIFYSPFSLTNDIFIFEYGKHFEQKIKEVPFLEQALYFLNRLYELGELKATQKGNLPKFFIDELYQKFFSREDCILIPHKEDDLLEAKRLKHILNMTGLIKKRKNKFYLTQKGKNLIKDKKIKELFNKLVLTLFDKWNWGTFDGYSELPLIQTSAVFNIHLLNKRAKNWISGEELGEVFLKAFPDLIIDVGKGGYFEPKTEIINCFNVRFLERVCLPLGFLDKKRKGEGIKRKNYYKLSPFFKQHFKFAY